MTLLRCIRLIPSGLSCMFIGSSNAQSVVEKKVIEIQNIIEP